MSPFEAIVLGILQGATEFLPVSSSGHLVMAQEVLDLHVPGVLFEVSVHLATLASVLVVYRARIAGLLRGAAHSERAAWGYIGLLALATLPAAVVGVGFGDRVEALFENPIAPGVALVVTGGLLWTARWALGRSGSDVPGVRAALLIGVAQAFALVPGISRSGATVVAALWLGVEAEDAAAFSFLLSVPAIAGAAVLQLPDLAAAASGPGQWSLVFGGMAAALTGVVAIRTFVALLRRRAFHLFAPYCWTVAGAYLLYLGVR